MKVSTMLRSAVFVALVAIFATSVASAQRSASVREAFGIHLGTEGAGIQYAITPSIQLGLTTAFVSADGTTAWALMPWAKFLLEGIVNPYFKAGLAVRDGAYSSGVVTAGSQAQLNLGAAFGMAYYLNQHFGVFGEVQFVSIGLSDGLTNGFGIFNPNAGVEVFF